MVCRRYCYISKYAFGTYKEAICNINSKKLPNLPLPSLNQTLQKYLKSVRPLLNDLEYNTSQNIVTTFGIKDGIGENLQKLLLERVKNSSNWLTEWWLKASYLSGRYPLVLNSNPGLIFPTLNHHNSGYINSRLNYISFVSSVISATIKFRKQVLIDHKLLSKTAENFNKTGHLCMSQYYHIFGNCRIPGKEQDDILISDLKRNLIVDDTGFYIVVICNNWGVGRIVVDLSWNDPMHFKASLNGNQLETTWHIILLWKLRFTDETSIYKGIEYIIDKCEKMGKLKNPVNLLTASNRLHWANAYEKLTKANTHNKRVMKIIQQSLFVLCLDLDIPPSGDDLSNGTLMNLKANNILHGLNSKHNTGNRWFDKTLQIIIDTDGRVGINYEHTVAEGPPYFAIMNYIVESLKRDSKMVEERDSELKGSQFCQLLNFQVDSNIDKDIEIAKEEADCSINNLNLSLYKFQDFGKHKIKLLSTSPDAFIQIALQLAYFKTHNEVCATYESASTRKFLNGRTETIRSCTAESTRFCTRFVNYHSINESQDYENNKNDELYPLLKKALEKHSSLAKEAMDGQGVDRHLLGLKIISASMPGAEKFHGRLLEIFTDIAYSKSRYFSLSTSQVSNSHDSFMFYGPANVNDYKSYGFCYNPRKEAINYAISLSSSKVNATQRREMNDRLNKNFQSSMHDLLGILSSKSDIQKK
ncbi:carnitine O-acetyltransferase-like isoform X1 [Gordionus sp. m RMFG-2023]|uniref:carnitine O-acetyltransferase-like isoform X1 n=2 Tax=Gordionus sp. m RMFG-2023 TaxID=3053472 RepID=UPI0031FD1BFD